MTSLLLLSSLFVYSSSSIRIFHGSYSCSSFCCYRWSKRYQETIFPAPFWAKMELFLQSQISSQNLPEINLVHDSKWLWKLYAIYRKFVSSCACKNGHFQVVLFLLGQNQLLLTKQSYVQDLLDVFCNYNKYYERGRITVKITGALIYVFQHIVGSSKCIVCVRKITF